MSTHRALIRFLSRVQPKIILCIGIAMLALLAVLDGLVLPDLSFTIFYLIPLIFVTRSLGLKWGLFFSVLDMGVWLTITMWTQTHSYWLIPLWNAAGRLGYFIVVTILVYALENTADQVRREKDLSRRDGLTGIFNRRGLWESASIALNRMRREKSPLTVSFLDIDDFKVVNDSKGHNAGDVLLRQAALTLSKNVRSIDCVARLGGDEFVLLMPGMDRELAERVMLRLHEVLRESLRPVTTSIGVVTFMSAPKSAEDMFLWVDRVMFSAKNAGKDAMNFGVWPANDFGDANKTMVSSTTSS